VHVVHAAEFEHAGLAHQFARVNQDFEDASGHRGADVGALQFGLDPGQVGLGDPNLGLRQLYRGRGGVAGRLAGVGLAAGAVGLFLAGQALVAQLHPVHVAVAMLRADSTSRSAISTSLRASATIASITAAVSATASNWPCSTSSPSLTRNAASTAP
jgi:hypothetical protein